MHNKNRRSTAAAIGISVLLAISVLMLSACSGGGSSGASSSGTGSSGGSSLSSGGGGSGSSTIPWTNLLFAYGMPQELVWNGTGYVGANGPMTSQSSEYGYQIANNPQVWSLTDPISTYPASALGWNGSPNGSPNGSLYVALGTAWFDTSPDGKTWTPRPLNLPAPNSFSFNAIAWSGSMWVAVGTGGAIVYSSDGITWTQAASIGINPTLDAVTWTGTQFVAGGTGGALVTSSDGINWTVQPAPVSATTDIIGLASTNKLIVAVANSETSPATTSILTSSDGITWTTVQPSLGFVPNSIGYVGTHWIAVGDYYSMTSPDGTTWTTSPVLNGMLYSVVNNGTEYVATGMDVNGVGAEYTSSDGLNWTEVNQVGSLTAAAISPNGSSIVAVGPTNTTRASSDGGATWSLGGLGVVNYPFDDVTWSPALNGFIALVQESANAYLYESSDGVTWTSLSETNCGAGTVIASPTTIVDAGTNYGGGGCVYTSTDGTTWVLGSAPWATQSVTKGYWTGSEFLVVGTNGLIATSTTGATWTSETTGTTQNLNGAAVSRNTMVVVGDSGTILTSNDNGSTWTPQTSGTTSNLHRVIWTGTQFYAVGDTSTLLSSPDGVTWTTLTTPFNNWPSTYPLDPPTEPNFYDAIWSTSINKLIIFGDNGLVATTP